MTRIQLCGRLSVEIDGVQLSERLRGRQVPLLLAYLVLNRARHVGRDELIDALWPNQPPVSEDAALRTLLSRLRSSLGSSALAGRDELILSLPEPVWIDVEAAAAEVTRALDALDARRRPARLGAGPGTAQHRQPRPAPGRPGDVARASAPRARGRAPAGARGDRAGRADDGRHAAAIGRARGADAYRDRALPRVRLRAADGGAQRARQRRRGATGVRRAADAAPRRARHEPFGRGDRRARAAAPTAQERGRETRRSF